MANLRSILFFLIFLFPSFAFSQVYYWETQGSGNHRGSTPQAAAQAAVSANGWQSVNFCDPHSSSMWVCGITTLGAGYGFNMTVNRYGDECSDPESTYDIYKGTCTCPTGTVDQGGQCVAENSCTSKNGQSQAFTKAGISGDGYGTVSGGFVAGVQSACFTGCAVSTVDQKCVGRVTGAYTCRGTAYYTGQSCATTGISTEVQENTSQLPLPTPQTINDEKPCVYSSDGSSLVCQSSVNNEKEGQFCGDVDGVKTCVDSKPTKNGIVIDTKVDTETKSDGSKVVTKTDIATKTVCKGANECSSKSTTTTTTTSIDGAGNTTGVSGSCTGEACPDKNTNPDGDGDGFGDCTDDDCGDGSEVPFETPEFEEVDSISDTTSAFMGRVKNSPILSTVSSIGLSGQGSCSMGSTTTTIGTISASSICDNSHWLDPLYFIFLAIHALAAVRVFLSA